MQGHSSSACGTMPRGLINRALNGRDVPPAAPAVATCGLPPSGAAIPTASPLHSRVLCRLSDHVYRSQKPSAGDWCATRRPCSPVQVRALQGAEPAKRAIIGSLRCLLVLEGSPPLEDAAYRVDQRANSPPPLPRQQNRPLTIPSRQPASIPASVGAPATALRCRRKRR